MEPTPKRDVFCVFFKLNGFYCTWLYHKKVNKLGYLGDVAVCGVKVPFRSKIDDCSINDETM